MQYFVDSLKKKNDLLLIWNSSITEHAVVYLEILPSVEKEKKITFLITCWQFCSKERETETETEWASTMKVSTTHLVTGMMDAMV